MKSIFLIGMSWILVIAQSVAQVAHAPSRFSLTDSDITTLIQALKSVEKAPASRIHIVISQHSAAEMPSYDPIAHYAGLLPGHPHSAAIWALGTASAQELRPALFGALELACMDTGFAGTKWKAIYDAANLADTMLPQNVTDRFANRHYLIQKIQQLSHGQKKHDP